MTFPFLKRVWSRRETLSLSLGLFIQEEKADFIVVRKAKREMVLLRNHRVLKSYRIALGRNPVGRKLRQGDGKTPEGLYKIVGRNPASAFHRSLRISYPNAEDRARARRAGVSPGGDIMIHGLPNGRGYIGAAHRLIDWTEGCIAVTNKEIEEIWRLVPDGTPVRIEP
jgi:murein L,D-transpeptidase YafK